MRQASPQHPDGGIGPVRVRRMKRPWLMLPLIAFAALVVFLGIGLTRDPRMVPSPLIGKPVPVFDLPPVQGRSAGLSNRDFGGDVVLLNVFASWCVACREEHPLLLALSQRQAVLIFGLNYKDPPGAAAAWLDQLGDPYARTGADLDGRVGINWGVYGVPETFVVDRAGRIAYKHIGPVTPAVLEKTLLPMVEKLRRDGDG